MKIGAIIIFYNPDPTLAPKVVDNVSRQVDEVCVVDNSEDDNKSLLHDGIVYKPLHGNKGIAAAQNIAIKHFEGKGFDYIISADQDTTIPDGTVGNLLRTAEDLKANGIEVGAVTPVGIDHNSGKPFTYKITKLKDLDIDGHHLIEVYQTMNSMSLIPVKMFQEVGGMDERLFIDGVDSEWCWRATAKTGARFFYDKDVVMTHQFGSATRNIGGHDVHITPPRRMYYQYRNFIWLSHLPYVPKRWSRINAFKYFIKIFYYTIKGPQRRSYITNIFRGIRDGLKKKYQLK